MPATSTAARCSWCPAQGVAAAAASSPAPARSFATPAPSPPPHFRYSRWAKGPTTFGPTGRILATLLLLTPLPLLVVSAAIGIGIIGVGLYLLIVLPWALRHIWAKAKIVTLP